MSKNIFLVCFFLFFGLLNKVVYGQTEKGQLCQGWFWTEEEANEKLTEFKSTYHDKKSWELRADKIRETILHGLELYPMPQKTRLKPIVRDRKVMNGYTVENVAFESMPGFWVTGNLYSSVNTKGKMPGIICPHGHWDDGRFRDDMQYRCAAMAKMGAVVFAYDMVGYGESTQSSHTNPMVLKIQTWNSIRSVDFLLSLKEVDPKRIAVTGASGGGTQTIILTAIDPRIAVAAPVVMVSAFFFGGCACESGMPIHKTQDFQTNNVEIAACAAPRPLLLVSDGNDWTKNTTNVEYPYIKQIYEFYNASDMVENVHLPDEQHDYGISKRKAVYNFFAKHLGLELTTIQGDDGQIDESFIKILPKEVLCVFDDRHTRPTNAVVGDKAVSNLFKNN